MKVGIIGGYGHGKTALREARVYFSSPVVMIKPAKLTEEESKKMLETLREINGRRAMLTIEPAPIEMIPYNSKQARFMRRPPKRFKKPKYGRY